MVVPGPPGDEDLQWLFGTNIEFVLSCMVGVSLPGMARERAVDGALAQGADYLLFYDADMIFDADIFLRLLKHQKPVVGALAFTARDPIGPVIYDYGEFDDQGTQMTATINPNLKYPRNALMKTDAIGFGVVLIQASVFRKIPKPWFNNPGVGEDIQFCLMCKRYGVEIFVDTAAKTLHKPRYHEEWNGEERFMLEQDDEYKAKQAEFRAWRIARLKQLMEAK